MRLTVECSYGMVNENCSQRQEFCRFLQLARALFRYKASGVHIQFLPPCRHGRALGTDESAVRGLVRKLLEFGDSASLWLSPLGRREGGLLRLPPPVTCPA